MPRSETNALWTCSSGRTTTRNGLGSRDGSAKIWSALFETLAKVRATFVLLNACTDCWLDPSFSDVKAQLQHEERRSANDNEYVEVASKGKATFIALGIWIEDALYVQSIIYYRII
jgi:hypothetical protein